MADEVGAQSWGSWAVSVAATGVGAVSSAAYTLAAGGGGRGDGSQSRSTLSRVAPYGS